MGIGKAGGSNLKKERDIMEGLQKTVCLGLKYLAQKVEDGAYGEDDDAFDDDDGEGGVAQAFLDDMHDYVIDKME